MSYNILASCDNNYIMPCGVMMCSVCESNKQSRFCFHLIIDESVTASSKSQLTAIASNYKADIVFHVFNSETILRELGNENISFANNISLPTYYRLFVESVLPSDIDRILYLDCDIVVRGNIDVLFAISMKDYAVACVPDISEGISEFYDRLGYSMEQGYFNAGVLLINLEYWRNHNLKKDFIDFYRNNTHKVLQHDQDILNFVCKDNKIVLPIKYNAQDGFFLNRCYFDRTKYVEQLKEAERDPIIIHYTGIKPWEKLCENPFKGVFFYYLNKTEWEGIPLVDTKTHLTLKNKLVMLARKCHLIKPKYRSDIKPLMK